MTLTDANLKIAEADGQWVRRAHTISTWIRQSDGHEILTAGCSPVTYTGPSGDSIRQTLSRLPELERWAVIRAILDQLGWKMREGSYLEFHAEDMAALLLASPRTLCAAFLRVKLNDPQLVIDQP